MLYFVVHPFNILKLTSKVILIYYRHNEKLISNPGTILKLVNIQYC